MSWQVPTWTYLQSKKAVPKGKQKTTSKSTSRGQTHPPQQGKTARPRSICHHTDTLSWYQVCIHPSQRSKFTMIIDVVRAVQYGAIYSPTVQPDGRERGSHKTSDIPGNAIVQIRNSVGHCLRPNTLNGKKWDSRAHPCPNRPFASREEQKCHP